MLQEIQSFGTRVQTDRDRHESSPAKLLMLLLLMLLIACDARDRSGASDTGVPVSTAAEVASDQSELFDIQVEELFHSFLEKQSFAQTETRDFFGGQMRFYVRGAGTPDYDRFITAWEEGYKQAVTVAAEKGVQILPLTDTTFSGRTVHVGISLEADTCIVNSNDSVDSIVQHILPTVFSFCEVNAFSTSPLPVSNGVPGDTVSNHHLVVVTPMPGHEICEEGQTRLISHGYVPATFCLSHQDALFAGFAHEGVHTTLRALYGPQVVGPFPYEEELLVASAEGAFIQNHLQYNPR